MITVTKRRNDLTTVDKSIICIQDLIEKTLLESILHKPSSSCFVVEIPGYKPTIQVQIRQSMLMNTIA